MAAKKKGPKEKGLSIEDTLKEIRDSLRELVTLTRERSRMPIHTDTF